MGERILRRLKALTVTSFEAPSQLASAMCRGNALASSTFYLQALLEGPAEPKSERRGSSSHQPLSGLIVGVNTVLIKQFTRVLSPCRWRSSRREQETPTG